MRITVPSSKTVLGFPANQSICYRIPCELPYPVLINRHFTVLLANCRNISLAVDNLPYSRLPCLIALSNQSIIYLFQPTVPSPINRYSTVPHLRRAPTRSSKRQSRTWRTPVCPWAPRWWSSAKDKRSDYGNKDQRSDNIFVCELSYRRIIGSFALLFFHRPRTFPFVAFPLSPRAGTPIRLGRDGEWKREGGGGAKNVRVFLNNFTPFYHRFSSSNYPYIFNVPFMVRAQPTMIPFLRRRETAWNEESASAIHALIEFIIAERVRDSVRIEEGARGAGGAPPGPRSVAFFATLSMGGGNPNTPRHSPSGYSTFSRRLAA